MEDDIKSIDPNFYKAYDEFVKGASRFYWENTAQLEAMASSGEGRVAYCDVYPDKTQKGVWVFEARAPHLPLLMMELVKGAEYYDSLMTLGKDKKTGDVLMSITDTHKHEIQNMIYGRELTAKIEFIFLDCASTQNEKAQIIPLTQIYPNIKYYHLDTDPGLYACWNKAVALCSADIIGNWNIDDRKSSNSFDILLKRFEQIPDLDLAYGITYETPIENEKYEDNNYTIVNAFRRALFT